jgi:hypothetical protein
MWLAALALVLEGVAEALVPRVVLVVVLLMITVLGGALVSFVGVEEVLVYNPILKYSVVLLEIVSRIELKTVGISEVAETITELAVVRATELLTSEPIAVIEGIEMYTPLVPEMVSLESRKFGLN